MRQHQNEIESSSGNNTGGYHGSVWDDDMSLEDHNVVVGFPAGTLASIFMGNTVTAATTTTTAPSDTAADHNNHTTATSAAETAANNTSDTSSRATTSVTVMSDDSSFDRTILSSTPSEDADHPMAMAAIPSTVTSVSSVQSLPDSFHTDERRHPTTSFPQLPPAGDSSSFISISTTASEYRYVEWPSTIFTTNHNGNTNNNRQHTNHHHDMDLLSLHPSMVDSYSSVMTTPTTTTTSTNSIVRSTSQQSLTHHGSAVFVNIGQHLTQRDIEQQQQQQQQQLVERCNNNSPKIWYEGFNDVDWEQMRRVGHLVLNVILEPEGMVAVQTMTPAPLILPMTDSLWETSSTPSSSLAEECDPVATAQEVLPAALLCPLCHDVMVGATVLDCGCVASTVCAECWQVHVDHIQALALADARRADAVVESDFVWVSALSSPSTTSILSCPTCYQRLDRVVSCHALEAAIQECLRRLPQTHDALKRRYRRRFNRWRETCSQQQADQRAAKEERRRNELLARMIAREEEVLWKCRKPSYWQRCGQILTSEPFMLLMAAAISVGFAIKAGARK